MFYSQKKFIMKTSNYKFLLLLHLAIICFTACKDDDQSGTFKGEEGVYGFGKAYTYIIQNENGIPTELGISIDDAAFDNLSATSGDLYLSLDYPKEASKTPFLHQYMGYAPHGHEPVGIYDKEHFDFHFYTTTEAERDAIAPEDTLKGNAFPTADYFPANSIPVGFVPSMGQHWIDVTSPELSGAPFSSTFIWGSFDSKVNFLEPMITKKFIKENVSFEASLKLPAKYQITGKYYPTKYGFKHANGEYHIYLSEFVLR